MPLTPNTTILDGKYTIIRDWARALLPTSGWLVSRAWIVM